nr:MAG TPA_asm: hypothetical protein [Caudoviricetes sp.]
MRIQNIISLKNLYTITQKLSKKLQTPNRKKKYTI